jgi:hypothetical protein
MRASSSFALASPPNADPLLQHRRRLITGAGVHASIVNGDKIEFQFDCGGCTLLATSYDHFDNCAHWIYLLTRGGKILDQVDMPDVFGFVQDVQVVAENELAFGYFGTHDRWHLVVIEAGVWSYARAALAMRMNRFLLSKRRLMLRRTQGAPWVMPEAGPASTT